MNKAELMMAISEKSGVSKPEVEQVFSAVFEIIAEAMAKQEKLAVPNFGSFEGKIRAERKGRNPSTGAEILIPEAVVGSFKPSSQLKEIMNKK